YLTAHYAATCILAESRTLADALPRILQSIGEALGWEAATYWALASDDGLLRCAEVYQAPQVARPEWPGPDPLACKPEQGLLGRVSSTAKPAWIEALVRNEDPVCTALARPLQLRGAFAFPVLLGQELCGVVTFFSGQKLRRDEQLQDIMTELGKQLGQ